MPDAARYAEVNGLRMYYEIHGAGPPLLMLHGGTCSLEMSQDEIEFFSRSFQVIAPEQMGHGRTGDDTGRAFGYHDMAETTVELLRELKVESASVLGFSDGGILALDLAIHHPGRVARLALSGANFTADGVEKSTAEWLQSTAADEWPAALRESYERLSPDGPRHWPSVLERLRTMWLTEPAYTTAQLAAIRAQTLIVAGDQDIVLLEHTVALFRAIPSSQLCIVPDEGHGAMPRETILDFLTAPAARE